MEYSNMLMRQNIGGYQSEWKQENDIDWINQQNGFTFLFLQLMSKLGTDQFPGYRQAGLKKDIADQCTAVCLQPPQRDNRTPEHIRQYRKSYKEQAGVTIMHYGHVHDPLPDQKFTYGIPTEKSEGVNNIMKASYRPGVNGYVNEIQQSKYGSLKREPLAKPIDRHYNMPPQSKSDAFKFGLPTEKNQYDVKETIYSAQNMPETEQIRQMYLKSHQDYDPGEQKKRPYDWKVDPTDFRFGMVAKNIIHNEMKQVMAPEASSDQFPETKLIKKNLNDFFDKKDNKLGKPANLGQKQLGSDHIYGMRIEANEWDAGKCLKGDANEYDVRQDDDLGRCSKIGSRNIPKQGDENRLFGVPSIRYDIQKPERQSVADPNNYADETTAIELLFPKQFSSFGVEDEDFNRPRPKNQILQIFTKIGFEFKGNVFEAIFERSKVIQGTILNKVSCSSFKKAIYEMCG